MNKINRPQLNDNIIAKPELPAKPRVTEIDRPKLSLPKGRNKVLLHSCCAPCSGEVMEAMLASGIDYSIYF